MSDPNHPRLTLVDPSQSDAGADDEFVPLPFYPWLERPPTLAIDYDEAATAIHLAHGELLQAARLLKVPFHRLSRLVRSSPRLQRILEEGLSEALVRAVAVPIDTIFDDNAGQRAKEWASTKILQSRLAMGHPLSPAPPATTQSASLQVNPVQRSITFRWRTDTDDAPPDDAA